MGDLGSIPRLERSPGERKDYPLQYSGLENSMDCMVHGITKSDTTERFSLSIFAAGKKEGIFSENLLIRSNVLGFGGVCVAAETLKRMISAPLTCSQISMLNVLNMLLLLQLNLFSL